jgi:hypothetical protein
MQHITATAAGHPARQASYQTYGGALHTLFDPNKRDV